MNLLILAGCVALVTGSQQFWLQASIFFAALSTRWGSLQICLVSGACALGQIEASRTSLARAESPSREQSGTAPVMG